LPVRFGFASVGTAILLLAALLVASPTASADTGSVTVGGATDFPPTLVGSRSKPQVVVITNNTGVAVTISLNLNGSAFLEFFGPASCTNPDLTFKPIAAGSTCLLTTTFLPGALGHRSAMLRIFRNTNGGPILLTQAALTGTGVEGYYLAGASGEVAPEGSAPDLGNLTHAALRSPVVGSAVYPSGGYWLVASDGGVFSFGDAGFWGSTGGCG
jgi:hypothetical protein